MRLPTRSERNVVELLSHLVAIETAEAGRYEAALAMHTCDPADAPELTRMRNEHCRHAAQMKLIMHTWGGVLTPQRGASLWTRGRRALARLLGDRAMLELMKREEDQLTRAYLSALSRPLPARVRQGLEVALREQLLHGGWYEGALERRRRNRKLGANAWLGGPTNRAA
jgi:hypothetical protein